MLGCTDFVDELRAGLLATDCALFIISTSQGVDEPTKSLWQEASKVEMLCAAVVTKRNQARANYQEALLTVQKHFTTTILDYNNFTALPVERRRLYRIVVIDSLSLHRWQPNNARPRIVGRQSDRASARHPD